jgi:hypothetical protein
MCSLRNIATCLLLALASSPTFAQQNGPRTLTVPATSAWKHALTDIFLTPKLAGFKRESIRDFGQAEDDIFATYRHAGTGTEATVYIFHAPINNVPIWYDRILTAMGASAEFSTLNLESGKTTPYALKGQPTASGMRAGFDVVGKQYVGTGLSLVPVNGWLVAIRLSSLVLHGKEIDKTLAELMDDIRFPEKIAASEAAAPLLPCSNVLPTKKAKRAKANMADGLLGSLIGSIPPEKLEPSNPAAKPSIFCKDASSSANFGVYRPDASLDAYLIALGDAGISVSVGDNSPLATMLGKGEKRVTMVVHYLNRDDSYTSFKSLPSPSQVLAVIDSEQPSSSSNRNGNITISVPK